MSPPAEARAVSRRFGDVLAVDGVDLEVGPGEVVGLLGANGAGKTTLIRLILGLLRPTGGQVRLFGGPPTRASRARVGYVPQGLGLYEDLTVEENLAFTAAAFRRGWASGTAAAGRPGGADLAASGLAGFARTLVRDLPLGVRRRAAFAGALAHRPELLVLDEPTSGVDPLARVRLWDTIRTAAEGGAGVLVTTHAMEEAENCDRLAVMASGRVVAAGTMRGIVGETTAAEVRAERWDEAFAALEAAGLPISLRGRTVRVPDGDPGAVRAALAAAGVAADVARVPATFDEAFVLLAGAAAAGVLQ